MIISTKIGQTSFVNENGTRVSATVLDYNSCTVVGNRTIDRDGYLANIIGFLKPKKLNKPQLKEFNKLNLEPKKIIKEQRINSDKELLEVGSLIDPIFKVGDKVSVQSKSTGKGFAGAPAKPLPVDFDCTETLSPTLNIGSIKEPTSRSSLSEFILCSLIIFFGSKFNLLNSFN